MRSFRPILVICLLAFFPTILSAQNRGGIGTILGAGARANGMGGAFIAIADDATAASWNPAGLAQLTKPEMSLVYDDFEGENEWSYRHFFANRTIVSEPVSDVEQTDYSNLGFGSISYPFPVGSRSVVGQLSYRRLATFPDDFDQFTQRISSTNPPAVLREETGIFQIENQGGINDYALSFATAISPRINLGASINLVDAQFRSATFEQLLSDADSFTFDREGYSFSGTYFDLGVLLRATDKISLGAVYHSSFTADLQFQNSQEWRVDGVDLPEITSSGQTDLEWPSGFGVGIAIRPVERMTLSADYSSTDWSSSKIDRISFITWSEDAAGNLAPVRITDTNVPFPTFYLQQHDTSSVRVGAEYVLLLGSVLVPLRAGYFQEEQIVNVWDTDVLSEQPEFTGYSVGTGVAAGRIQVDVAYVRTEGDNEGVSGTFGPIEAEDRNVKTTNDRVLLSAIFRF